MPFSATFVMTYREQGPERKRNLEFVLTWYGRIDGAKFVLVEQDVEARLDSRELPSSVRYVFARNPGPFNKSWGLNVGARHAQAQVMIMLDADLLLPERLLRDTVDICQGEGLAANPYDQFLDLGQEETDAILAGTTVRFQRSPASGLHRIRGRLCFCGGAFLVRAELFRAVGGFDERFIGWGGEDDAMSAKIERIGKGRLARVKGSTALHLWHPTGHDTTFGQPHYKENLSILRETVHASPDELAFLCAVQRQIMGNERKYEMAAQRPRLPRVGLQEKAPAHGEGSDTGDVGEAGAGEATQPVAHKPACAS